MADVAAVQAKAASMQGWDEAALEIRVGMLERMLTKDPSLKERVDFELVYEEKLMGPLDDLKKVGRRILLRWNKELHGLVCGAGSADTAERKKITDSLNMGEAAVIGAVAAALIGMGVPAPVAAAAAPFIVNRFIWPAKQELCGAWGEKIRDAG